MQADYLTPRQIADRMSVSLGVVYAWVRSGELSAIEVGANRDSLKKRYRIPEAAFEQFRKNRTVGPPPPQPTRRRRLDEGVKKYY